MSALLEVVGLQKRFGAIVVADDVTFSLESGHCLGMIGPNGAGKSSVFNLIAGTIAPDGGTIRFDGRDLGGVASHLRARRGIVRAFQIPQPFPHLTVYENVLAAASFGAGRSGSQAQTAALDVLATMGLVAKAEVLAGQLPLLDRKRLELGKAVASRAKLLLLDEIAAGLTEPEVEDLVALIATLKTSHAIIWIEHIPHALRAVADRILVLHFGRNVLEGPPADVMTSLLVREIYMGFRADDVA
ncbi:MAG: ABC transporter ATP-binding protein [Candidatus Rokuibacteriota bacterium]|nr:MAG: ABC transporter ATP-binding protein [Candidatus Rokubacteria bacterium]